ncbi:MAG: hypothetical protein ABL974_17945 [Prosthecobacter sp.]
MFLIFHMLVVIFALISIPILAVMAFTEVWRRWALRWFIVSIVALIAGVAGLFLINLVRNEQFRNLAARSEPLIAAIHHYEKMNGAPPKSLEVLVPGLLPKLPGTRMGAYPNYVYLTGEDAAHYNGNPWILQVPCPLGFSNWDEFLYFPLQNYPATEYGGVLERMGTWAYLHE